MSHFTTIKTELVRKELIVKSLRDLGHQVVEGPGHIRDWSGEQTEVELRIPTQNPGYDLGFRMEGETYALVADWYGIHEIQQNTFLANIQQRYAYHASVDRMKEQGFEIAFEKQDTDNNIQLIFRPKKDFVQRCNKISKPLKVTAS